MTVWKNRAKKINYSSAEKDSYTMEITKAPFDFNKRPFKKVWVNNTVYEIVLVSLATYKLKDSNSIQRGRECIRCVKVFCLILLSSQ